MELYKKFVFTFLRNTRNKIFSIPFCNFSVHQKMLFEKFDLTPLQRR